jgi:leucyl-tRNA synthetase
MAKYEPREIERRWQKVWEDERTWQVDSDGDGRDRAYVLEMLPYTSGEPHIGHLKNWGISIDWSRELATHQPRYYRWTQWIFRRTPLLSRPCVGASSW